MAELLSEKRIFRHRSTDALMEQLLDGSISLRDRSPVTLDGYLDSGPVVHQRKLSRKVRASKSQLKLRAVPHGTRRYR